MNRLNLVITLYFNLFNSLAGSICNSHINFDGFTMVISLE